MKYRKRIPIRSHMLNVRIGPNLAQKLNERAKAERVGRSTLVRRLLADAIRGWLPE